jgi:tetraprenyl-beta-curcumene synthase
MSTASRRFQSAALFIQTALRYWLGIYPHLAREMRYWKARAASIDDPLLRRVALEAQRTKRGNIEGAAAFAVLVPRVRRALTVKMIVAWQAAYDYADLLAEQPCDDRCANARQLHLALLRALQPGVPHDDYYAHYDRREDDGYLRDMIDTTRAAFTQMSNIRPVSGPAEEAITRIIAYQALNQDDQGALESWAKRQMSTDSRLQWWETAAAGASSLVVLALLAAAADPRLSPSDVAAIERAYYPWIGALHTLLDSLIDLREDALAGQVSLLSHYNSLEEAGARMQMMAEKALRAARGLRWGGLHALILAGMVSLYLTAPEASFPEAGPVPGRVLDVLGGAAMPSMLVLRARRAAGLSWADMRELVLRMTSPLKKKHQ